MLLSASMAMQDSPSVEDHAQGRNEESHHPSVTSPDEVVGEPDLPEEFRQPEIPDYSQDYGDNSASAPDNGDSRVGRVLKVENDPPMSRLPGDPVVDRAEAIEGVEASPSGVYFENQVKLRTAVQRDPPPELSFRGERVPPKRSALVVFGYRHFFISDGLGRHQDWHIASIELAPFRRYFRLNLLTEIGFEGGDAAARGDSGDLFVMEKVGIGVQYPHWVTPFLEFQGGIGAGRIELFERNDLALLTSMGLDLGAQWSVVKHVYLLASVGWIRPYFMEFGGSNAEATYYDRATFKVGVGF